MRLYITTTLDILGEFEKYYHLGDSMKIYTKESLISELKKISDMGWIENARYGNSGGIGNTLEDLLGISEKQLANS